MCTGKDPKENIAQAFHYGTFITEESSEKVTTYEEVTKLDPLNALIILMLTFSTFEAVVICLYSKQSFLRSPFCNKVHSSPCEGLDSRLSVIRNLKFEETKNVIISNSGLLIVAAVGLLLLSPLVLLKEMAKRNPEDINHGFGRALFYIGRITMPILSYYLLPLVAIFGNRRMRRTLKREILNLVQNYFP